MNALRKWGKRKNAKKHKSWNLISLKVSKTGKLGMAKPCLHCIVKMSEEKYNIKNVFYSNSDGEIVKTSLTALMKEDEKHVSRLRN